MTEPNKDPPPPPKKKRPGKKKGSPKTGGREKGTPNRNSARFLTALDQAQFPLVEFILAEIACLATVQDRVREYKALLRYCYPKLKSVEQLPTLGPAPAQSTPAAPMSPEERLALIRGKTPPKSGEPG